MFKLDRPVNLKLSYSARSHLEDKLITETSDTTDNQQYFVAFNIMYFITHDSKRIKQQLPF